jgi:hypothetical protein
MDNCFIFGSVLYALRIRNINNIDVGDWCVSNCFFYPLGPAGHNSTSAIRIESSGGGKIVNCKINGTSSFFANGIDIIGFASVAMQITNCSIENFSSIGISVNGSLPNVTISNCEIGAYAATAVNAISMVNTSAFIISGIVTAGSYSGPIINLSGATNYFIGGISGVNWTGSLLVGGNSNKVLEFKNSAGDLISHFWDVTNGYTIQNALQWMTQFATGGFLANFQTPNGTAAIVTIQQTGIVAVRYGLRAGATGLALVFDDSSNTLATPAFGIRGSFSFPASYGCALPAAGQYLWSSSTDPGGTVDTGSSRVAAGVSEHNNGTVNGVGYVRLNGVAVASLPAPSGTYQGARGTVNNSNATLSAGIGAVVAGGGTNVVPVFCDGTNWRIG